MNIKIHPRDFFQLIRTVNLHWQSIIVYAYTYYSHFPLNNNDRNDVWSNLTRLYICIRVRECMPFGPVPRFPYDKFPWLYKWSRSVGVVVSAKGPILRESCRVNHQRTRVLILDSVPYKFVVPALDYCCCCSSSCCNCCWFQCYHCCWYWHCWCYSQQHRLSVSWRCSVGACNFLLTMYHTVRHKW